MDMERVETKNYYVRRVEDADFEKMKELLLENEYLNKLWHASLRSESDLIDFISNFYIKLETYCIVEKETEKFCGIISSSENDNEGELSVRMMDGINLDEILSIFSSMLKTNMPQGQKNLTIEYSFE